MTLPTPRGHINASDANLLRHIARGATIATAATRCGITPKAAMSRLARARARVGATSTAHLLALAIATRQIPAGTAHGSEVHQ